jgi:uncharacterized protein
VPKRETAPIGAPCWMDVMTSDTDKTRAFYGELFGWTSESSGDEFGGYINFFKDGVQIAGCMAAQPEGVANVWSVYLAVTDAKATCDAAVEHGGSVMMPAMDVGDLGTMAVLVDPGNAVIGIWEPKVHKGFGLINEPGAPSWFELHTRDYDRALDWYRKVFGWKTTSVGDSPEFRYTTLGDGDDALAGVMDASSFLPDGVPAHWSVYFHVSDIDASFAKARELGGATVQGPEDTPYGKLGTLADATGSVFKLRQT